METRKTLGRGQALQRVMDHSISNRNVTGMNMENYSNDKIVAFLGKVSESDELGPPAQNLPSQNFAPPLENKESEKACISTKNDRQWKTIKPSTSTTASTMHEDHSTKPAPNIVPGQFNFSEDDFPPL